MKNKSLANWNHTPDTEMLAFFANLVDEMTFNYTIDSFKAPALNVISLMQETLYTIEEVECGNIADGALGSLFEEMKDAMTNDKVFNSILTSKGLGYLLQNVDFKQISKTETVNILKVILEKNNIATEYPIYLIEELKRLIKSTKKKECLEEITRSFITQLRNDGYSDEYLYFTNRDFFFGRKRIESLDAIEEYFKAFDYNNKNYEVYFIGHELIENVENRSVYEVIDEIDNSKFNHLIERYVNRKSNKSKFLKFSIFAKDGYSARNEALQRMHMHFSLLNLYHHKYRLSINPNCLIYERISNDAIVIKDPTKAIMKCKDQRIHKAIESHRNSVNKIQFNATSSARFYNALKLHDEALIADTLENQYINLFTAIEVLIPKDAKSGKDRILQIYDTLVPYLCINYYQKLIDSVLQSLLLWNSTETNRILNKVNEGTNCVEKLAALMVLGKYDGNKKPMLALDELYEKLGNDNYSLMLNRMYKMHNILKNRNSVVTFLTRHEQRLRWHIDRIYRVRNSIVHAGKSPKYLSTLVENLHSYLDILLNQLIEDNIKKGYEDIGYSFTTCYYLYRNYMADIKNEIQKNNNDNDLTKASEKLLMKSIFI